MLSTWCWGYSSLYMWSTSESNFRGSPSHMSSGRMLPFGMGSPTPSYPSYRQWHFKTIQLGRGCLTSDHTYKAVQFQDSILELSLVQWKISHSKIRSCFIPDDRMTCQAVFDRTQIDTGSLAPHCQSQPLAPRILDSSQVISKGLSLSSPSQYLLLVMLHDIYYWPLDALFVIPRGQQLLQ